MSILFSVIDILSKAATIAVPLVTFYQIKKNLIDVNKPFLVLSDGIVGERGYIALSFDKMKDKDNTFNLFCFNTYEEFRDKTKEPYIVNIKIDNAGNGMVKGLYFYRIRDVDKMEFIVMTDKINNVYNYGLRIRKDNSICINFEANEGMNYYIIKYLDYYNNAYFNVLQVYIKKDSNNENKIIMKTYEEFNGDEVLSFKGDKTEKEIEDYNIRNTRNNIKKVVEYIIKRKKKPLMFNVGYKVL